MNSNFRRRGQSRFLPPQKLNKETVKKVLSRIWFYLRKHPGVLVFVTFAIIITSSFNLALPILLKYVIDKYLNVTYADLTAIFIIVVSTVIATLIVGIFSYLQSFLIAKAASFATKELRNDAFHHLTRLPISYIDNQAHGDLISKFTNDTETILNLIARVLPQFLIMIITLVGAVVLMIITSWRLSIVVLIVLTLMVVVTTVISKGAQKHFIAQQAKLGSMNGILEEDISGLKAVKLYNQEENMIKKFALVTEEYRKANFKGNLYAGMMIPLIRLVDNILYALIVAFGALFNIRYGVSIGSIQAMTNFSRISLRPVNSLAEIFNVIQIAIAGGERVFRIMDEKDEYQNDSQNVLDDIKGNVKFQNVYFEYKKDLEVLKNINFEVKSGETVAIVGPTGSGKTTIINLLTRFYDVKSGDILIDGVSIYDLSKSFLRRHVGIVLQTTYLFKGTVFENIKYGKPDATREEVIKAAKLAQVHDIIERLPKKYDTKVKEGGLNFSHGERQLISIARTILANPSILILDEATSSVDTRTESQIQKSMDILMKGRTTFVIAHRLQTIKNADKIIVILNGEIIETGNHHELLAKNGLYAQMYKTQFNLNN
ncbi:MAG TPA: ABC transporter ATP-binding protein [Bacilli bacterium]